MAGDPVRVWESVTVAARLAHVACVVARYGDVFPAWFWVQDRSCYGFQTLDIEVFPSEPSGAWCCYLCGINQPGPLRPFWSGPDGR